MRAALLVCAAALALTACSSDCDTVETDIGALCLPDALAPDLESVLDVREACGPGCAQGPSCTAVVLSGALYLTLREEQCDATTAACIAAPCEEEVVPCTLPALGPGDYPVVLSGGPGAVLHVRAGGTSACHLPQLPDAGTDGGS